MAVCAAAAATNITLGSKTCAAKAGAGAAPVFRFGVIADIQYAPIENATNFAGSETRNYRGAADEAAAAVEYWNEMQSPDIAFVAQVNANDTHPHCATSLLFCDAQLGG